MRYLRVGYSNDIKLSLRLYTIYKPPDFFKSEFFICKCVVFWGLRRLTTNVLDPMNKERLGNTFRRLALLKINYIAFKVVFI